MRRVSRVGVVAWSIVSLGGCAALSGLDALQKCPDCGEGGAADVAADVPEDRTMDGLGETSADSPEDRADAPGDVPVAPSDACSGGVMHDDGVGQTFCDSVPAGTHNMQLALDACAAFTGNVALCDTKATGGYTCSGFDGGPTGQTDVCSDGTGVTMCDCWSFTDPDIGHVSTGAAGSCRCPTSTDPTYN